MGGVPFSVVRPVVVIVYAIGIAYLIYLTINAPVRLKDIEKVFVDDEVADCATPV